MEANILWSSDFFFFKYLVESNMRCYSLHKFHNCIYLLWPVNLTIFIYKAFERSSPTVFLLLNKSKCVLFKNCSKLIGSSFQSSQKPWSTLHSSTCLPCLLMATTQCSTSKTTERDCGSCKGTSSETRTSYVQFFKIISLKLDTN